MMTETDPGLIINYVPITESRREAKFVVLQKFVGKYCVFAVI
jgi:hypothetical protein